MKVLKRIGEIGVYLLILWGILAFYSSLWVQASTPAPKQAPKQAPAQLSTVLDLGYGAVFQRVETNEAVCYVVNGGLRGSINCKWKNR